MNELLQRIERTLVAAIEEDVTLRRRWPANPGRPGRRRVALGHGARRRATLALAAVAALCCATAVAAVVAPGPLDRLLSDGPPFLRPSSGDSQERSLAVTDAAGLSWSVTTYRTVDDGVATTVVPDGLSDRLPPANAANAFNLAVNAAGGPASLILQNAERDGTRHYLVAGTADARAEQIAVDVDGQHLTAALSPDTVDVAVQPPDGLTAEGQRLAATLPPRLRLRTFAATFVPQPTTGARQEQATITITDGDGRQARTSSPTFCVGSRCTDRALPIRSSR